MEVEAAAACVEAEVAAEHLEVSFFVWRFRWAWECPADVQQNAMEDEYFLVHSHSFLYLVE